MDSVDAYIYWLIMTETGMSEEIKVGDRVRRKDGKPWSDGTYVTTVSPRDDLGRVWGTDPLDGHKLGWLPEDWVEKAYPHDEVVRAWLDGKTVQTWVEGQWTDVRRVSAMLGCMPAFYGATRYRIKPECTERGLEIERIEQELRSLADKLKELKNG